MNNYDKVEPGVWYVFQGGDIYRGDEVPAGVYHPNHDKLGIGTRRRRLTINDLDLLQKIVNEALARDLVEYASQAQRAIRELRDTGDRPVGLPSRGIIVCDECLNYVLTNKPTGHHGSCSQFPSTPG